MNLLRSSCLPVLALTALVATSGCVAEQPEETTENIAATEQAFEIIGTPDLQVSAAEFESRMHVQLKRAHFNIMGYSFALVKGG